MRGNHFLPPPSFDFTAPRNRRFIAYFRDLFASGVLTGSGRGGGVKPYALMFWSFKALMLWSVFHGSFFPPHLVYFGCSDVGPRPWVVRCDGFAAPLCDIRNAIWRFSRRPSTAAFHSVSNINGNGARSPLTIINSHCSSVYDPFSLCYICTLLRRQRFNLCPKWSRRRGRPLWIQSHGSTKVRRGWRSALSHKAEWWAPISIPLIVEARALAWSQRRDRRAPTPASSCQNREHGQAHSDRNHWNNIVGLSYIK